MKIVWSVLVAVISASSTFAKPPTDAELYDLAARGKLGACSLVTNFDERAVVAVALYEFDRPALCFPQSGTSMGKWVANPCWISKAQLRNDAKFAEAALGKAIRQYRKDGHCASATVDPKSLTDRELAGRYRYDGASGAVLTLETDASGKIVTARFSDWGSSGKNFSGSARRTESGTIRIDSPAGKTDLVPVGRDRMNYKFGDTALIRAARGVFIHRISR